MDAMLAQVIAHRNFIVKALSCLFNTFLKAYMKASEVSQWIYIFKWCLPEWRGLEGWAEKEKDLRGTNYSTNKHCSTVIKLY